VSVTKQLWFCPISSFILPIGRLICRIKPLKLTLLNLLRSYPLSTNLATIRCLNLTPLPFTKYFRKGDEMAKVMKWRNSSPEPLGQLWHTPRPFSPQRIFTVDLAKWQAGSNIHPKPDNQPSYLMLNLVRGSSVGFLEFAIFPGFVRVEAGSSSGCGFLKTSEM